MSNESFLKDIGLKQMEPKKFQPHCHKIEIKKIKKRHQICMI